MKRDIEMSIGDGFWNKYSLNGIWHFQSGMDGEFVLTVCGKRFKTKGGFWLQEKPDEHVCLKCEEALRVESSFY